MNMESMYQEVILDHYRNPHGRGLRDPFEAEVMHVNPTCGDEITLRVQLGEGVDPVVEDVSYWSQGCSISQASASILFDEVEGQPISKAFEILDAFVELMHSKGEGDGDEEVLGDLVAFEGVSKFPARVKCALLAWMAFKDAVGQARPELVGAQAPDEVGVSLADPPRHELQLDTGQPSTAAAIDSQSKTVSSGPGDDSTSQPQTGNTEASIKSTSQSNDQRGAK